MALKFKNDDGSRIPKKRKVDREDSDDDLDEMYESINKKKQNKSNDQSDSSDDSESSEDEWVIKTDTNRFKEPSATDGPKLTIEQQSVLNSIDKLNKLKSEILKAKLKGDDKDKILRLENEYNQAKNNGSNAANTSTTKVLDSDELRMYHELTKHRKNASNDDGLSVSDMVREEIAEKNAPVLSSVRKMAELKKIGKDAGYENDTDYQFENAEKLAEQEEINKKPISKPDQEQSSRRQQKEESKIRETEKKLESRILEHSKFLDSITSSRCYLCPDSEKHTKYLNSATSDSRSSRSSGYVNKIISASPRVYLARPPYPALSKSTVLIIPREHRPNLLHCDDDEWEEIRNYMKCLIQMWVKGRGYAGVVFYENAVAAGLSGDEATSTSQSQRDMAHGCMYAVPIKDEYDFRDIRAMFQEGMLNNDEEWSQHRKIIDTQKIAFQLAKDHDKSAAKHAVRKSLAKEAPYFHVWLDINGGLGHIVEDRRKWPRNDLFAREILGNLLRVDITKIRRTPRWENNDGNEKAVWEYQSFWNKFDWAYNP